MNNYSPRQERILRIFTPVRCLGKDQMRRYHLGQMTGVEQHLVEQHLIECDLCHDALATLENPANTDTYQQLSHQLSQYIQREYAATPTPAARPQKQLLAKQTQSERKSFTDSFQSYFWTIVFLGFGGGSIFLLQQHLKNRPPLSSLPLRAADAIVLPAPRGAAVGEYKQEGEKPEEPLVIQTKYSTRDTSHMKAAVTPAVKDTVQKKKPVKDSALPRPPAPDTNARALAQATPPATPAKEPPKEEPKEAQKETPKEKTPENTRAAADNGDEPTTAKADAAKPVSGDDFVYRSAMQYQQQGDFNEAINQYRKLSDRSKYSERARYQMAVCYRAKGQKGKARRLFRELANSDGSMKSLAQAELSAMN